MARRRPFAKQGQRIFDGGYCMSSKVFFKILGPVLAAVLLVGGVAQAQTPPQSDNGAAQAPDSDSYSALLTQAVARISQGDWQAGARAARRAFAKATTPQDRVAAARLVASANFRAGRFGRAEWWLRRAFNNAKDSQSEAVLRQEYAAVRQKNPWTTKLSFSIAPNDNVNNGSASETILIWNLPFVLSADARALAGIETSASVDLKYRLSESQTQATRLGLQLYGRTYQLSAAASKAAPGVSGSDYAFAMAELSLTHDRKFAALSGPTSFGLSTGQFWYGGNPYIRYTRATIAQSLQFTPRTGASLQLAYEEQTSILAGGVASYISTLGGGLTHQFANNDTAGVSLRATQTISPDITSENVATQLQLTYSFGKAVLWSKLSLNLSGEKRDYGFSIYDASGRHDLSLTAGINMVFFNASYFGFSPTLSLEMGRTRSNVSLYNRDSTAIRLGIQSTF
jgi:hypothetical protein